MGRPATGKRPQRQFRCEQAVWDEFCTLVPLLGHEDASKAVRALVDQIIVQARDLDPAMILQMEPVVTLQPRRPRIAAK